MSAPPDNADPVSERPSWDASQVNLRPWLEDLFPWLQTRNQSYAPLIEKGYVLTTQGRVVVTSNEHAEHMFFRLDPTYSFESPSPINPSVSSCSIDRNRRGNGRLDRRRPGRRNSLGQRSRCPTL
eukprot:1658579-Pleurochrysis_carterae.AAC.1